MSLGSGRCHDHPERPGLGICVECRNVICAECTTQFEGINRCAKCLGARLARAQALGVRREWSLGNVAVAVAAAGLLFFGLYGLVAMVEG
jgi:hypothetical protein